jgi:DNA-binding transcriptional MerR regulator
MVGSSDPESRRGFEAGLEGAAYRQLVDTVSRSVEAWLERSKGDVIVLAPCGCSRAELLKRLMKPGEQLFSKAYVYKGFKEKVGALQGVVVYESLGELVEELRRWSGGRVVVVPESSCEAVALKQMLRGETPKLRARLLYLPKLHSRAARGYSREVRKLARVEHPSLGEAYKSRAKGHSSALLRAWSREELEELVKAKEAILRLSPGRLGLRDYLVEAAGKTLTALAVAPLGAAVALALDQLLSAIASLNLHEAAQALLAKVGGVPARQAEGLASRVVEGWSRSEARNKVAEGLARLIAAAREAAPHLGREELEAVVDQVALEWGMDAPTFKVFVRNLAKLASGELVTREELRKELEKLMGKELEERLKRLIEDRLREIEEKMKELQKSVEGLKIGVGLFYAHELEAGLLYSNFRVEKGRPVIGSLEEKGEVEAELVTAGSFERLAGEVLRRLEGGFVVLEGPKGIGKSTLAAYTAWLALLNGQVDAILSVSKLDVGEASRLENLVRGAGERFLVLYDPSPLHAYYEPGAYAHEVREAFERSSKGSFLVEETLRELLKLKGVERVNLLVVLPDDIYRSVIERNPELKDRLERYTLRVDLRDPQFLEEVVKAYSGCTGSFKELAESIAKFEDGYTLVAKHAGLWLREKGCSVKDVRKALEEAKGSAKLFLAYYLWSVLLKGSRDLAIMAAAPLILHSFYGPVPEGATYLVKAALEGGRWRLPDPERLRGVRLRSLEVEELKPLAKWLSVLHEDLVEEALKELCSLKCREIEGLTEALDWAWSEILREEEEVPVPEKLLGFVGKRLEAALEAHATSCWRRLALIAGSAFAGWHSAPLAAAKAGRLPSEALKPCELDGYLLVSGEVPPLIVEVALHSPHALAHPLARWHREAAEEIKDLEKTWRDRGGAYLNERLYALGLALSIAGAAGLGEDVEVWEAEAALYAAAGAVQRVSRAECAAAALEVLKPLGELAPHYHVSLALAASVLYELGGDAAREIANAVGGALQEHGEELEGKAWSLAEAVNAYYNLLTRHAGYFSLEERELMRGRMCELLGKLEGQLRAIAEALALAAALEGGLEPCGGGEATSKAVELLEKLERVEREGPSGPAVEWARVRAFKPEEFKLLVKEVRGVLAHALASYTMDSGDLEAAEKLFESAAAIYRERGIWESYLVARSMVARCSTLEAGSLGELRERAKTFASLWSEAKEHEKEAELPLAYLRNEADALAEYLVSLALEGRVDEVSRLLEEGGWLLRRFPHVGVATRLLLERLGVNVGKPEAWEVAAALGGSILAKLRPAFNTLMGLPVSVPSWCSELKEDERLFCSAVDAVRGDERATAFLKQRFRRELLQSEDSGEHEVVGRFRDDILDFVEKRDASTLVQLWAPAYSNATFVLMLWALSNNDEELARAHAKLKSITLEEKLPRRLFREAAEVRGEGFELALLKLFYYHF